MTNNQPKLDASEFRAFAELGEQISATPAKLEKTRLLAEYLRSLPPEQLRIAAIFLTGKPFAQSDQRTLQTGWAIIFRALLAASGRISVASGGPSISTIAGCSASSAFSTLAAEPGP